MALERFSPRKSRLPPTVGGLPPPSFGRKLFIDAQAFRSLPSTVKWSRLRSCLIRGCASRAARKPCAIVRDISQAVPVAGSFVGASDALLGMTVEVSVLEAEQAPAF